MDSSARKRPFSSRPRSALGSPNASLPASIRSPNATPSRSGSRRPSADSTRSNPARSPASPRSRCSRRPVRRFGEKPRVPSRSGSRAHFGPRSTSRATSRIRAWTSSSRSGEPTNGSSSSRTASPVRPSTQANPRPRLPLRSALPHRAVTHSRRRGRPSASAARLLAVAPLRRAGLLDTYEPCHIQGSSRGGCGRLSGHASGPYVTPMPNRRCRRWKKRL
jgi:hypothetical protein